MAKTIVRFKTVLLLPALLLLGGCAEKTVFTPGDIKDDFCGVHLNYQYCKCAFHNDFCDAVGLDKGGAKDYVNAEYDKWVAAELAKFQKDCDAKGGIARGKECRHCGEGEIRSGDRCVARGDGEAGYNHNPEEKTAAAEEGCKYDSDCDPICEGSVAWKMGCNPRSGLCEKTFDTDCGADNEIFGSLRVPKICLEGICTRDAQAIGKMKTDLMAEKQLWSDTVKEINKSRDGIRDAMMEANKNCINGIADMTNVAIMEFSTRIASVLAGGIPDAAAMAATAGEKASGLMAENMKNLAGAAVDYAGDAVQRLYNYQQGEPPEAEKKLAPHEYIKLNCDLYEYFKQVMAESDADLAIALAEAAAADQALKSLP